MGRRFWKQSAAAVLLTTSVLSFSSVTYGNTTVDQSFNSMKAELNRGTTNYVYPALRGQLVSSNILYPSLNSAKRNYELTRKVINSSSISTAQKESKLQEIDNLYNEKIVKGLIPYIDAYNYATKYLVPIMSEINAAQERNDFATVEKGYHQLSYQLKGRSAILYRFSGKAARDLLLDHYKKTADAKRDELMVPVTIYMEINKINNLLANGKIAEAKAAYAEIDALLHRLPDASSNKFVAALLNEVAKVREAINGSLTPQEVLDSKVAGLVTFLNQSPNFTMSTIASNSLIVTIQEDESILDFLNKGFYSAFTSQLGVTKVNGKDPISLETIAYIQSLFPTGAKSLSDLKGQSIILPLTVNNGAEIDVNFSISFQ